MLQSNEKEESDEEYSLFQYTQRLLVKDGGILWNSTYYMLYRAIQLRTPIQRFQSRQVDATARDDCYSASQDKLTAEDWEDVCEYLRLLRTFVEAAKYLEGNTERDGDEGMPGSLWEVIIWLQPFYSKVKMCLKRLQREPHSQL